MRHVLLPALLVLAACHDPRSGGSYADMDIAAEPMPVMESADVQADYSPLSGLEDSAPATASYLAYRHSLGLVLPTAAVEPTMAAHMRECQRAGPTTCQVLGSRSDPYGDDSVSASLSLRADPNWLEAFRTRIRLDAESGNGRVTASSVSVEDLTRSILDTDARLRAQTALRDRLQALLEARDGELADLLAVERELARVQGEIESATSVLKALRQRVDMSALDITYSSRVSAVSSSAFAPLGRSFRSFFRNTAYALSTVVDAASFLLPWFLLVILPLAWLARRAWRGRRQPAGPKRVRGGGAGAGAGGT